MLRHRAVLRNCPLVSRPPVRAVGGSELRVPLHGDRRRAAATERSSLHSEACIPTSLKHLFSRRAKTERPAHVVVFTGQLLQVAVFFNRDAVPLVC